MAVVFHLVVGILINFCFNLKKIQVLETVLVFILACCTLIFWQVMWDDPIGREEMEKITREQERKKNNPISTPVMLINITFHVVQANTT